MKKIKEIVIGICAVFGVFIAITGFTADEVDQETPTEYGIPESHEWQVYGAEGNAAWLLNKKTGEIRLLDADRKEVIKCKVIDKSN